MPSGVRFEAKMHKIRFPLGIRPRPHTGSLQRSPRPSSCILHLRGLTSKERAGKEGGGEEEKERRRREEETGGNGRGHRPPKYFGLEPPLELSTNIKPCTTSCQEIST